MWKQIVLLGLIFQQEVQADVAESSPSGFILRIEQRIPVAPAQSYQRFAEPSKWWSKDHSWSGSAMNFSIQLKPGGCFCEEWDKGFVEHGRMITAIKPDIIIMDAAFGPLQRMGLKGTAIAEFKAKEGETMLTLSYHVLGSANQNLDKLAPVVDQVLTEQVDRLAKSLAAK
jgi:hypothetical protein